MCKNILIQPRNINNQQYVLWQLKTKDKVGLSCVNTLRWRQISGALSAMTSMVGKERDRSMWVCLDCMAFPTTACDCELRQSRRGAIYSSIGLTSFQIRKRCSRTRRRVRPSGSRRRASTTRGARSRQGRLPTWHCEMCLLSPKYHSREPLG